MKSVRAIVLTVLLSFSMGPFCSADQDRIPLKEVVTKVPSTTKNAVLLGFTRSALPAWIGILSSTTLLYKYDEDILSSTQAQGRRWGLTNIDKTKAFVKLGKYDILRLPTDAESTLYFLGDGWLHVGIAGGFLISGHALQSNRSFNTGAEIAHGMIASTILSQALKHASGRQSPDQRTAYRGRWRPFPSVSAYNARTAEYDAMPSGHIMTATLVWTIIRGNFPEYDRVLFPSEVVWLTALGFGMVNNGVHWVSDYPLGIALGYVFGKASLQLAHPEANADTSTMIFPGVVDGTLTANWLKWF